MIIRQLQKTLHKWTSKRATSPVVVADDPVPTFAELVNEAEKNFYSQPSRLQWQEVEKRIADWLSNAPKDWQALHRALTLAIHSGYVTRSLTIHRQIAELKLELAHAVDLDQLGFRVLPVGYANAIGNLAILDLAVKAQHLGWSPRERILLPVPENTGANDCLVDIVGQQVKIIRNSSGIGSVKDFVGVDVQGATLHLQGVQRLFWEASHAIQREWEHRKLSPLWTLKAQTQEIGQSFLKDVGLKEGDWWICLHVRSAGKYQDDWSLRNASITHYLPAIEAITRAGGWVIRMGDAAMPALQSMERVVDYAHYPNKVEDLDIYLVALCRFFFGTASGLGHVPTMFGVPGLFTNWISWGVMPWSPRDLIMPKLIRNRLNDRIITAQESLSEPIGFIQDERHLRLLDLECLENTPEDLRLATEEMLARVNKGHLPELTREQELFLKAEATHGICQSNARLVASFGRNHPELW